MCLHIRYLGFFKKYNVLILTMKGAMPSVIRFVVCAGMIYMGFVFCGWIILGVVGPPWWRNR